jgi:5-methyltetrahydrofolate--homocysteine methyltransferase
MEPIQETTHARLLDVLYEAIVAGQREPAADAVRAALEAGLPPARILDEGMIEAMAEVGQQFEEGDCYVPEMMLAARAMQQALDILKPVLQAGDARTAGRVVIGTVEGDMHDIGKNLVIIMLEGAGFEVVDLGVDVKAERFVEAVRGTGCNLLALSALLTTTMPRMKGVLDALAGAGLREQVKVLVGGAPLSPEYAVSIGADGYAADAGAAARKAQELVGNPA